MTPADWILIGLIAAPIIAVAALCACALFCKISPDVNIDGDGQ